MGGAICWRGGWWACAVWRKVKVSPAVGELEGYTAGCIITWGFGCVFEYLIIGAICSSCACLFSIFASLFSLIILILCIIFGIGLIAKNTLTTMAYIMKHVIQMIIIFTFSVHENTFPMLVFCSRDATKSDSEFEFESSILPINSLRTFIFSKSLRLCAGWALIS